MTTASNAAGPARAPRPRCESCGARAIGYVKMGVHRRGLAGLLGRLRYKFRPLAPMCVQCVYNQAYERAMIGQVEWK